MIRQRPEKKHRYELSSNTDCKITQDFSSCRKGLKSLLELFDHASINPWTHSLAGRSLGFGAGVLPRCRAPVKAANSARVGFETAASPRTDRNIWSCPRVDRRRCQGRTIWARLLFGDQLNGGAYRSLLILILSAPRLDKATAGSPSNIWNCQKYWRLMSSLSLSGTDGFLRTHPSHALSSINTGRADVTKQNLENPI